MKTTLVGGLFGLLMGAMFLMLGASRAASENGALTQDELDPQIAAVQQQIDGLNTQITAHGANFDAHASDATLHRFPTPVLGLNYCIAVQGQFPSRNLTTGDDAETELSINPLLGSLALFGGNFAPPGWMFCEGQLLPISQNQALFSILGTTYGGDGRTTFGLPDLRQRAPMHPNGISFRLGERAN